MKAKKRNLISMTLSSTDLSYHIAAFYQFIDLPDYHKLQPILHEQCEAHDICGMILLASEGVNGTISGSKENLLSILKFLETKFGVFDYKLSKADKKPFLRLKVRLKKEIIRMGLPDLQPAKLCGKHVEAEDWNELISDDNTIVVDTRNDYEIAIGRFQDAVNPQCRKFSDFPAYVESNRDSLRGKKIAMYCTGGIRCEKASAYMLQAGFDEVYQLKGGILKYLENMPAQQSLWQGECFVFDRRVSVGHGLQVGDYGFCAGCRGAVSVADKLHPHYEQGITCPRCYHDLTEDKRRRFTERQKQMQLASKQGLSHLGSKPKKV